jgi:hypothetical protein
VWTIVVAAVATAGGCWQEVSYDPATRPPRQSSIAAGEDDVPMVPGESSDPLENDIFGGDDPLETTPVNAAPVESGPPVAPAVRPRDGAIDRPPVTAAERQVAWTLANNWSVAAAMSGAGLSPDQYAEPLAKAGQAAQELGLVLPELPTPPDADRLAADVAAALRGGAGAELATAIGNRLDAAAAAATRLAVTGRVLLLIYKPLEADAPTLARELREAGVASQLPDKLWQPLADLVSRRSEYEPVQQAVISLRQNVEKHFAAAAAKGL